MTQRVNIQYTIDVEDLAPEVRRLYKKASTILNNTRLIEYSEAGILSSATVDHIHEIRLNLSKIDASLSDVQSIVGSYVEYKLAPHSDTDAPQEAPTLDDLGSALKSDLAALSQQLEQSISHEEPPQRPT